MSDKVKFIVYEIDVETGRLFYPKSAFVEFSGSKEDASALYAAAETAAIELAKERRSTFTIVKVFV